MKKLCPEDITRYQFLTAMKTSPEGTSAALCVSRADPVKNGYTSALWKLDLATEQVAQVTANNPRSWCYLDDDHILYTSSGTEADQQRVRRGELLTVVSCVSLAGGDDRIVYRIPLQSAALERLSGGRLLLSTFHDNRRPDFESMVPEDREQALAEYAWEKEWDVCTESPFRRDGKGMVDGKRTRLFVFDPKTDSLTALTEPWFDTLTYRVNSAGTKVAVVGETFTRRMDRMKGVYLYDLETGTCQELLPEKGYQVSNVEFVGDTVMACAVAWDGYGPFPNHDLYQLIPATGEAKIVYRHLREDNGHKTGTDCRLNGGRTMASTGDTLYYITSYDNYTGINVWQDGKEVYRITMPAFGPEFIAVTDQKVLAVGFRDGLPQELYCVENGTVRQLSAFNAEILSDYTPVKPELTSFINSDGVRIDGFVIYPADYDPNKKYPGILEIHGGPRAAYSDLYSHEMQLLSSNGYFVFYCNPRGSSSRGEAFSALKDRRGTIDYEDIMAFTDHVIANYPALDGDRLGVTGISFGGFMTNWIIGHTTRFRAAVPCCSIVNNISFFGDSDENNWGSLIAPWDNLEKGWDGSPLKYYRNVTTPTMFIQTYEDYRCPLSEAIQFYTALQIRGVETKLCMFHNESHCLSRLGHPRNRIRRLQALLEWMDDHLK